MQNEFVIARADVDMRWTGPHPRYRLWVGGELFAERTWIWHDFYLDESIQIEAPPGKYEVRYECLDPEHARLRISNLRIDTGPAIITKAGEIQIYTPESRNES
jgi:hypothetical protein